MLLLSGYLCPQIFQLYQSHAKEKQLDQKQFILLQDSHLEISGVRFVIGSDREETNDREHKIYMWMKNVGPKEK